MSDSQPNRPAKRFMFPRWANFALPGIAVAVLGGAMFMPTLVGLAGSPKATAVGYMPDQPIPYSHALHVGKLGLDCRYCHSTVEKTAFAAIPPTQTCMNCHSAVKTSSDLLKPLHESWQKGTPVKWVKIHDLPDYAYFNHSAHVNRGVGCVSCHGRIDHMDVVWQDKPLSMSWCLDCHKEPELHLRPKDQVTNMAWKAIDHPFAKEKNLTVENEAQLEVGKRLKEQYGIRDQAYMTACYTCHR